MGASLEFFPVWGQDWPLKEPVVPNGILRLDPDERIVSQLMGERAEIKTCALSQEGCSFVQAKDLKRLAVGPDASARNYALKAYINALPDSLMVVLCWV